MEAIQITEVKDINARKPKLYDVVTIDLSVGRINEPIHITGDFIYISEAPSTMVASVSFNHTSDDSLPLKKRRRFNIPFSRVYLTNTAGAGTLTIIIGKDLNVSFDDGGEIDVYSITEPLKPMGVDSLDAAASPVNVTAAATLIVAARARRYSVTLYNEGANPVRIGKSDVTFASKGILLNPGASFTSYYTGAIYGIAGAALSSNVSFADEYNS